VAVTGCSVGFIVVGFDTPLGAVGVPLVVTGRDMRLGVAVGFDTPGQGAVGIPLVVTGHGMCLGVTVGFDTPGQGDVGIPLVVTGRGMGLCVAVGFDTPGQGAVGIPLVVTGRGMGLGVAMGFDTPGQGAVGIPLVVTGRGMRLGVTVGFDTSGQGDVGSVTGRGTGLGDVVGCDISVPLVVRGRCVDTVEIHRHFVTRSRDSSIPTKSQSASVNSPHSRSEPEATLRHSQQGCYEDCDTVSSPVNQRRHSQPLGEWSWHCREAWRAKAAHLFGGIRMVVAFLAERPRRFCEIVSRWPCRC